MNAVVKSSKEIPWFDTPACLHLDVYTCCSNNQAITFAGDMLFGLVNMRQTGLKGNRTVFRM